MKFLEEKSSKWINHSTPNRTRTVKQKEEGGLEGRGGGSVGFDKLEKNGGWFDSGEKLTGGQKAVRAVGVCVCVRET